MGQLTRRGRVATDVRSPPNRSSHAETPKPVCWRASSLALPGAASAASPTVTTLSAASIGQTTATLRADVNPQGAATTYTFQYGRAPRTAPRPPRAARARDDLKRVTFRLTGLTPGVRYHYRVIASNADGTTTGADRSFKTDLPPAKPPTVLGTAPFGPTANGVTFTALVHPGAAATTYRFQYGTSTAYGLETFGKSIGAGVVPQSVSFRVNSLASRTTYHFRVVASNRAGTTFGPDTIAQTGPFPPRQTGGLDAAAQRRDPLAPVVRHERAPGPRLRRLGRRRLQRRHGLRALHLALRDGRTQPRAALSRALLVPAAHARAAALSSVTKLRVHVHFGGNAILTPFDARSQLVRFG